MSEPFDMRLAVDHVALMLGLRAADKECTLGNGTSDYDCIYTCILALTEFVKLIGPVPYPERYVPREYASVAHVIMFWACKNAGCDYGYEFWDAHPEMGREYVQMQSPASSS